MVSRQKVGEFGDLFTLDEWKKAVEGGLFNSYDGSGSWVQVNEHGLASYVTDKLFDDVFSAPPEGATHVEWFNK